MGTRSQAREVAFQMLYQQDLNSAMEPELVRAQMKERLSDNDLLAFAWSLFTGTMEARVQLDAKIEGIATNWTLKRMAPTDRNIVRLGAFELLFTDTPHRVVIDEAVELAKKFGGEQSPQFVNGLLDQLIPDEKSLAE